MILYQIQDILIQLFDFTSFKKIYLKPDLELNKINNIDVNYLKSKGICAIAFDVDSTLCKYGTSRIDLSLVKSFSRLKKEFKVCIISNTSQKRKLILEKNLGIHIIQSKRNKPSKVVYDEALAFLNVIPVRCAMIGDRYLTDIVGANRGGMYSIKVNPLDLSSEPILIRLIRSYEAILIRFICR